MKTKDAIKWFGNQNKLCIHLGITRANVSNWGYWMPAKHAQSLSFDTDLEYSRDLYAGKIGIEVDDIQYFADTSITHFVTLQRNMDLGCEFWFLIDGELKSTVFIRKQDLKNIFKNHPMYSDA